MIDKTYGLKAKDNKTQTFKKYDVMWHTKTYYDTECVQLSPGDSCEH